MEAACQRALAIGARSYKSVESILKNKLECVPMPSDETAAVIPTTHEYVRGQSYFE